MIKQFIAMLFALLAAVLYAINIPVSKILLNSIHPVLMASFLYFGAGIGMFGYSKISKKDKKEKLSKKELPYTIAIARKSQPFMIYLPICVGLIMHA